MRRFFASLAAALFLSHAAYAQDLPALGADLTRTTVSGLSSGGYMAGQFHIAYSDIVKGAAIIAGGPYGCARTPGSELNPFWMQQVLAWNLRRALERCMDDGWWLFSTVPSISDLYGHAANLARRGVIAPLENLAAHRIYLFTSSADDTVHSGVVRAARDFYLKAGVPQDDILFREESLAAHAFVTENQGLECGVTGPPYINDCDYDQAGALLEWLAGPLQPPAEPTPEGFIRFSQSVQGGSREAANLGADGMAYIPAACREAAGCPVHVVFHGCRQGLEQPGIGEAFVRQSGHARWAEGNGIILLFPQAAASTLNPRGCWDWWGYTGRDFLERGAAQMRAVRSMLDRLAASP